MYLFLLMSELPLQDNGDLYLHIRITVASRYIVFFLKISLTIYVVIKFKALVYQTYLLNYNSSLDPKFYTFIPLQAAFIASTIFSLLKLYNNYLNISSNVSSLSFELECSEK